MADPARRRYCYFISVRLEIGINIVAAARPVAILFRERDERKSGRNPRRAGPRGACALVLTILAYDPAAAQETAPPPSTLVAMAGELASRGDTSGALATLQRAVRLFPGFAEAHYWRGLLLVRSSSGGMADLFRRRAAQGALERALELDRDNPRYLLELGRLRLKTPFLRFDAGRLFRRAAAAARTRGDSVALADVEAEIGDIFARRADVFAQRRMITSGATRFDPDRALEDWRYAENFINQQSTRIDDAAEADRRQAEEHYRAGLAASRGHEASARGLLALLHDGQRYEEYLTVARAFARAAPGSARAQLTLGLGLTRTDRPEAAAVAFDWALALLSVGEQREVLDLSPILRRSDAERYRQMAPEEQQELERVYWSASDPLRLTSVNEHRVEHLARVAYADLRFSSEELGLRGWETDRGVIYIRYGPPPVVATFGPATESSYDPAQVGRITTVWWYPERRLRFVFTGMPGYNVARFAGDFSAFAEDARYQAPARYDNVPVSEALDSVPIQVARFRDSVAGMEVVVFAGVPIARMLSGIELTRSTLETGLFVTDLLEHPMLERRGREPVVLAEDRPFEERTYEVRLGPGSYRARVEALEPSSRRAARGTVPVTVTSPPAGGLDLSDVVLADRVAERIPSPRGRRDFFIDPNPAMSFPFGQRVHLLWEIYGLRPDSAGVAPYTVAITLRLQGIERTGLVARLVGGAMDAAGLTAEGEDQVVLTYRREVMVRGRDRVPEHVALDLAGGPPGVYELEVGVEDRRTGQSVVRSRTFRITRTEAR